MDLLIKETPNGDTGDLAIKDVEWVISIGEIYVFHINCNGVEYVKVGITHRGLSSRLTKLQTGNPFKIRPILSCSVPYKYSIILEKRFHKALDAFWTSGEWFLYNEASDKIIEEIFTELSERKTYHAKRYKQRPYRRGFESIEYTIKN